MFQSNTAAEHRRGQTTVQKQLDQRARKTIRPFKLPTLVAKPKSNSDRDELSCRGDAAILKKHRASRLSPASSETFDLLANEDCLSEGQRVQTTMWWKLLGQQIKKTANRSVPYESLVESADNIVHHAQRPVYVLPSTSSDCESLIRKKTSSAKRTRHLLRRRWLKQLRRPKINLKFGSTEEDWSQSEDGESYINSLPYSRLRESCDSINTVELARGIGTANGEKQHARREQKKTSILRRFFKLPQMFAAKSFIIKDDSSDRTTTTTTNNFFRYEPLVESSESSESLVKLT